MQEKNEHFSMWAPFKLSLQKGYHFVPRGILVQLGYILMKTLVILVFRPFNWLFFGTRIRGRENLDAVRGCGAVTVCNHIHPLDCTMVACAARTRKQYFLTIQSNMEIPLVRHLVRILGGVPIPRQIKRMRGMNAELCRELQKGKLVHIYPEGELWPYYDGIRGFKDGAFRMAYDAGVPIVPMVVTFHNPTGLYRLFRKKPCLHLTVLEPIVPDLRQERRTEIARLSRLCRERMTRFYQEQTDSTSAHTPFMAPAV